MSSPRIVLVAITALVVGWWLLWAATLFVHDVWRNADRRDAQREAEQARRAAAERDHPEVRS